MGLVLGGDPSNGVGALELQDVALCLVRGTGLVEFGLAVPLHPDLHPAIWAPALEVVSDYDLAPDPVARLVIAVGLLDSRSPLEFWVCVGLWRCRWWEAG